MKWTPRRLTYLLLWGTTLLAFLSDLQFLPSLVRFLFYASAMVANSPGVILLGQLITYAFTRTPAGHLLAAALTTILLEPILRWIERPARRQPLDPTAGSRVTRRAFLLSGSCLALGGGVSAYGFVIEKKHFVVRPHRLYLPGLPASLEGLRIVLFADMHCGPMNRPSDLQPAMALVQELKPDLLLIPGDFVHLAPRYFEEAAELLSPLRTGIPGAIFCSWGNHDHWNRLDLGKAALIEAGCQPLIQQHLLISPKKTLETSGPGLCIAGVDDLWEGSPDLTRAMRQVAADQPRILLCHNPDVAEEQHGPRIDLMVSGHTHGGQIRVPGVGTPVLPSRYGQKYASGLVQGPHFPVYVTRGLGVGGIPVRLGVPPEVTFFELHSSQQGFQCEAQEYFL